VSRLHFEHLVWRLGLTENEALTVLQDNGAVSDLCLNLRNIADSDLQLASDILEVVFLKEDSRARLVAYASA